MEIGEIRLDGLGCLRVVPDYARPCAGSAGHNIDRRASGLPACVEGLIDGAAPVADGAAMGAAVGHVGSLVAARRASLRRSVALLQSRHVGPDFHCIVFSGVRSWPFLQLGALIR